MFPPTAAKPAMMPASGGGNEKLMAFRQKLGVPTDQPAPESKVIEAMSGKMGPDVQRMAQSIGGAHAAPMGTDAAKPGIVPNESGMHSGTGQNSMAINPGNTTPKVPMSTSGADMFSGRPSSTGTPIDDEDDEDRSGASMFGGRRK